MSFNNDLLEQRVVQDQEHAPCPHCQQTGVKGEASGWHRRTGPAPLLRAHHRLDPWQHPHWVDHPYRVRLPDGRWCYVAEPYLLWYGAFEDFAFLIKNGFTVTISAELARHYPGHTIAVLISERGSDHG
jgi:hypothetical protein